MKMATRNWGHEQMVNDEVIKNDLRRISGNALDLDEETTLDYLGDQSQFRRKKTHKALSSQQQSKKKNRKRKKKY